MPFPLNMGHHQPPMGPMFPCGPPPHHTGAQVAQPQQPNPQMQQPCQQYLPFGPNNRHPYQTGGGRGPPPPPPNVYNQHFFNGPPPPGAHQFTPAGHHCSFTVPSVTLHPFPNVQPPPSHLVNPREQVGSRGHHPEASTVHTPAGLFTHDHLARTLVQGVPHHQAFAAMGAQQALGPQHHQPGTLSLAGHMPFHLHYAPTPMNPGQQQVINFIFYFSYTHA